ncbi:DUF2808 domain-containing protein [Prochlorococcus marinus]|uniref:DUF2808 domain-containing protein n=1 Tax=Prochlorococcus marinus TaxID=1219 RepID=UPI0022B5CC24|nr:DUF2808 domain-containing protein [Prochlorococcus marinus]
MFKTISKVIITSSLLIGTFIGIDFFKPNPSAGNTGLDFMWDPDPSYIKLKYLQSSKEKKDRSTYYLFLRGRDRKTGILKLSIKVPDYFDANIKREKLSFCQAKIGGFSSRTKCVTDIPAIIEISDDQTSIEIFPDQPIPVDKKTYALKMKIFNPRRAGMFQFHAYAQSPGALPISSYVGSWNMSVE